MTIETPVASNTAGTATPAAPASKPAVTPVPASTPAPAAPVAANTTGGSTQTVPVATLLEERGKRQALEAELEKVRQQMNQPQPQPTQQPQPIGQEIDKLWETDPRRAVDATIMMAIDWYDKTNNSIDIQADLLASKYPDFNTWRSNATRYVRSLPPQQRSQPGALEMAYFVVRGQNVDDILKRQNDEMIRKFQAGELAASVTPTPGAVPSSAPKASVSLTDQQRLAAQAMGISEEEYIKYSKPGAQ